MKRLFTFIAAAAVLFSTVLSNAQNSSPPAGDVITVVASGTGTNEETALKQAFSNAVTEAVGTIVDTETLVKNDRIITDQVLTASNAIVTRYDPLGSPQVKDGLVTVRIKATVQRKQLIDRLTAANVISKAVEGKDLFAQVITDLQREKDGVVITRRVFDGFPGNVLKAEPVGQPRVISKTDADATIGVTIRLSYDVDKYQKWLSAITPLLSRIATKSEQRRLRLAPVPTVARPGVTHRPLRPATEGPLVPLDKSTMERFKLHVPAVASASSYSVRGNVNGIPNVNLIPRDDPNSSALVLVEHTGSSGAVALYLDDVLGREVLRATFALPIVEVRLVDQGGTEIDKLTQAMLYQSNGFNINVTPFFNPSLRSRLFQDTLYQRLGQDWKPTERELDTTETSVVIAPYIAYASMGSENLLLAAYDVEYEFVVPLERLKQLKNVEVKVFSRNNVTDGK